MRRFAHGPAGASAISSRRLICSPPDLLNVTTKAIDAP
jgi:hypothetical protein